ncbi:hypothetical protein BOX15_Mlig023323g1 [Macrostomum lignano]|uniref:poly(ADP-ribose) glycohydrolase n=1 Tax=Macrostomum lignano TaxID=282301 RepID=A0A267H398_9PLAT|nr:hypothetical protein BOX15_Mlig023323g1 [Macrostomum lignano]
MKRRKIQQEPEQPDVSPLEAATKRKHRASQQTPPTRRSPRKAGESSNPPPASLNRSDTDPVASADPEQQKSQVKRVPTDDSVTSSATEPIAEEEAEETETDDNDEESQRLQHFLTGGAVSSSTVASTSSCRDWRRQLEALRPEPNLARLPFSCPPRLGHSVLFRIDNFYEQARSSQPPQPWPTEFSDRWDSGHVRMPCSPSNASRWSAIEHSLNQLKPASSIGIDDLATVLNVCSGRRQSSLCLDSLNCLLTEELGRGEMRHFLNRVLPGMVRLALALPHLVTTPPPLLRCGYQLKVTLSQLQVASLLANAFFSTFPRRSFANREYANFPTIHFSTLFSSGGPAGSGCPRRIEKLKCLFNYFQRVTTKDPLGVVTFSRRVINERIDWSARTELLPDLLAAAEGTIEDDGAGMLEVDFANAYIGGGVLGRGLVQEEIRFLICPELLLSRLLAESLEDGEALWITGAERYSNYTGYSSTFQWNGDHTDTRPRDTNRRLVTKLVAIDARCYSRGAAGYKQQFNKSAIDRELHKALVGFGGPANVKNKSKRRPVATGNWGCGAFGGDLQLKSLIQLMACAVTGRSCVYFTFGDTDFQHRLQQFQADCRQLGLTVGSLYRRLINYCKLPAKQRGELFTWLLEHGEAFHEVTPKETSSSSSAGRLVDYDYDSNDTDTTNDEDPAAGGSQPTVELPSNAAGSDGTLLHQDGDLMDLTRLATHRATAKFALIRCDLVRTGIS